MLREIALSLPEAEERETWGQATFRIRNKMFAILATDETRVAVKCTPEEQSACIGSDPDTFYFPPYVGKAGWVGIVLERINRDELAELVTDAWRMTAPKRLLR